jgi:octanoyl-[GcvH]:protein N-octanoyltransferase
VLLLTTQSWHPPSLDAAVSAALLSRARDEGVGSLRLFVPGRAVVFGRQDRSRPDFDRAVAAAAREGFAPVMRLAGGRAAVFHEGTVAIALTTPESRPRETIIGRFELVAAAVAAAIGTFGVDARVGEVTGEYCPGGYSVNAGGRRKIAGLGQRLTRGAAHVGGVVVVEGSDLVVRALEPVYRHLGYDWDPLTTGAVTGHAPATTDAMIDALAAAIAAIGHDLIPDTVPDATVAAAHDAVGDHDAAIA